MKESFFQTRKTTAFFAIIGLVWGSILMNKNITGKIVLEELSPFDLLSLIGMLLILCSIVVGVYSLKKK